MIFIIVFFLVLLLSLLYHSQHPPTQAHRYRSQRNRQAAAKIGIIAVITTCVKLIKEKE